MKKHQDGFVLILLILGVAIAGIVAAMYFTKDKETQKSQYEQGQEAIEQAKVINQQGRDESTRIQEQLDLQNNISY